MTDVHDDQSEERKALTKALEDYFRMWSEGGLMTDYLVTIAGVALSEEHATQYAFTTSNSPLHSIIGLAELAKDRVAEWMYEDEDDEQ